METPRLVVVGAPPPPLQFRHRRPPPPPHPSRDGRLSSDAPTPGTTRATLAVSRVATAPAPSGWTRKQMMVRYGMDQVRHTYTHIRIYLRVFLLYLRVFLSCFAGLFKRIISLQLLFQGRNLAGQQRSGDILELFSKAQRNILQLDKRWLGAKEELKKLQDENKLLLQDIEVLETEVQGVLSDATQSSNFSELLLRVDTVVIPGMITMVEASAIRKKVVDNRNTIQRAFSDIHLKSNTELLSDLRLFMRKPIEKPLHIVHICIEMDPVASSGSLSTYVAGLSCALRRNGNLVEVIMPKYTSINLTGIHGLRKSEAEYESYFGGHWHKNRIWTGTSNGVGLILIKPVQLSYFNREMLCGYPDDFERFSYFSRASLDYIVKSGKLPDILHIYNSETAIVAPLFWDIFAHQGLENTRILLTCQDLDSQCLEEPATLELCGLDPCRLHRTDRLQDPNKTHLVNITKGGIVYSNKVVLVSSTHSKDFVIQDLRHGLDATLTAHRDKILVASHGLDGEYWNPSKDIYLPRRYSPNDIVGKSFCREALKWHLGPSGDSSIIVGCICDGDLDIHNLKEAFQVALSRSAHVFVAISYLLLRPKHSISISIVVKVYTVQVILLVNSGPAMNSTVHVLKEESKFIKQRDQIAFVVYDEALVHLIFAGSDIILCSSFQDRSLQTVIKAIKYGSVPVQINFPGDGSRQSEGHDCHNKTISQYIISTYGDLSLSEALDAFENDPYNWDQRIKDGMAKGLSWDAECYNLHWEAYSSLMQL